MDNKSFEQISLPNSLIGENKKLLRENLEITISLLDEKPMGLELPKNLECQIDTTDL